MSMFENWKCRASGLDALLSEPQKAEDKKAGRLSQGAKDMLHQAFYMQRYRRSTREINTTAILKGTDREDEGITLVCRHYRMFAVKNTIRMESDYLTGEWDVMSEIDGQLSIIDIKNKIDLDSFLKEYGKAPEKKYVAQLNAYYHIAKHNGYDVQSLQVADVLVSSPEWIVEKELRSLEYKVSPDAYKEEADKMRNNMVFDDIPWRERINIKPVPIDESILYVIPENVTRAREYLVEMERVFNQKNLMTELK